MRMAPSKIVAQNTNAQNKRSNTNITAKKGITTRSKNSVLNNVLLKPPVLGKDPRIKRKADRV